MRTIQIEMDDGNKYYLHHGTPLSSNTIYDVPEDIKSFRHSQDMKYLESEQKFVIARANLKPEQVSIVNINIDSKGTWISIEEIKSIHG